MSTQKKKQSDLIDDLSYKYDKMNAWLNKGVAKGIKFDEFDDELPDSESIKMYKAILKAENFHSANI